MTKTRHERRAVRKPQAALLTRPSPPTMDERRGKIVEFLKNEGKIRVEELSDRLEVSQVTIRKDLDALERQGLLERSHGNAVFSQQSRFNIAFLEKLQMQASAKELIAAGGRQPYPRRRLHYPGLGNYHTSARQSPGRKIPLPFCHYKLCASRPGIDEGRIRTSARRRSDTQS